MACCLQKIVLRQTLLRETSLLLLALLDIHFMIAGKIAMARGSIVNCIWLSAWATHTVGLLSLHLLNYAIHELTRVLQSQELLREPLVVGT